MNPTPVRVMTVDREEAITVRPLTLAERISYGVGYLVGWLAHGIHDFVRKLRKVS